MLITINKLAKENIIRENFENDCKVKYYDDHILVAMSEDESDHGHYYDDLDRIVFIVGTVAIVDIHVKVKNIAQFFADTYYQNPKDFLKHCEGNFVIAVYDKRKRKLTIVRDPLGLKHVYYSSTKENFYVSTSLTSILHLRDTSAMAISTESLNLYLTFQYLPQPYTMFSGIHQVPLRSLLIYETPLGTARLPYLLDNDIVLQDMYRMYHLLL